MHRRGHASSALDRLRRAQSGTRSLRERLRNAVQRARDAVRRSLEALRRRLRIVRPIRPTREVRGY